MEVAGLHHDAPFLAVGRPPSPATRARSKPLRPLAGVLKAPEGAIQTSHPRAHRTGSGEVGGGAASASTSAAACRSPS
eukprot:9452594-Alexandrium_andersonii.AAC.1